MPDLQIDFIVPVALKEMMEHLVPVFEQRNGTSISITHVLNPEVPGLIAEGHHWDIAITNPPYINDIIAAGHTQRSSCHLFASAPLAFCAKGDYGTVANTPDTLAQTLRSASSIALTDTGTSGDAFRYLLRHLDLREDLSDRLLYLEGGGPMRAVLEGRAALAALPLTNIEPVAGVSAIGICPAELCPPIEFALCLSPNASLATHAFKDWLLDEMLDNQLANLGAMHETQQTF